MKHFEKTIEVLLNLIVYSFVVMASWNLLAPGLLDLPRLSYFKAMILYVFVKSLSTHIKIENY